MPGPKKPAKKTVPPRQMSGNYRHWAQNRKKPAPLGRYEDMSPLNASRASKKAIKKASAEGPKKRVPRKKK